MMNNRAKEAQCSDGTPPDSQQEINDLVGNISRAVLIFSIGF
ncbi:hypothetical protein [Chania multitudinisentens]|nr:hypothetical protein [Chania multitudinisentens]